MLSQSVDFLFILFTRSFAEQKFFILMKSNSTIFLFMDCTFSVKSESSLSSLRHENDRLHIFLKAYSLFLTFKSKIHFELFFVWVHFFPMDVQLVMHHLIKSLYFLHWISFPPLPTINWTRLLGSMFEFSALFLCQYHTTLIAVAICLEIR